MVMHDWGYIKPETVARYISFERNNSNWIYNPDNSIFAVQAEGVAGIWNQLNDHKLAILADEVGMGKTMQAFGVCALLWNIKPDARIIVLAPNHSVAQNWENEFKTFIDSHYKLNDNQVRAEIGKEAIHKPVLCGDLDRMAELAERRWCHFLIGKISSLSYTGAGKETQDWEEKIRLCREKGEELRQKILGNFKTVDLLIIDEAQYFRNKDGDSLRVNTAKGLFGEEGNQLADRVLLMTATPNHSQNKDIQNIVSYFNEPISKQSPDMILQQVGIRRFRRLAGKTKYQYRLEKGVPCDFTDNPLGELFFGLYQKELVRISQKEKKQFMYGYLEGFESTRVNDGDLESDPEEQNVNGEKEKEDQADSRARKANDYRHTADSEILLELASEYKRCLNGNFPVHPKYTKITTQVVPDRSVFWEGGKPGNGLTKSLIFVRRIPSVRELTARINNLYDKIFLEKIYATLGAPVFDQIPQREQYEQIVRDYIGVDDTEEDQDPIEDEDIAEVADQELEARHLNSQVFDLFRSKKDDDKSLTNTHASLFRNRFTKDNDPFSIFFQPPLDYKQEGYKEIYYDKDRPRYISSALYIRLKNNRHIYNLLHRKRGNLKEYETIETDLSPLWSVYYPLLPNDEKNILNQFTPHQKEAYAKFLQQGVLRASPGLIEIYCWFIQAQKNRKEGRDLYQAFIENVKINLADSLLMETIQRTIRQFSVYAEKICGIFKWEDLVKREWTMFNRQNPCYSCSGSTSNRQRLIQAFNSPFFPNTLVSTSVLQEGVNLQYNCDNTYHYGIAWTPGDNEQRVGRIDRLFSKTERKIRKQSTATLDIYYPYLDNSFDRDQVAAFIQNKYHSEKTLDKCIIPEIDRVIAADASTQIKNWEKFFRKPDAGYVRAKDPYPPSFQNIIETYKGLGDNAITSIKTYWDYLQATLRKVLDSCFPGYTCFENTNKITDYTFPLYELQLANGRTQPLKIELSFSSEFSGLIHGTVYCLCFTTPLANSDDQTDNIDQAYREIQEEFPLPQICRDTTTRTNERIYMRTDLPLFVDNGDERFNIHELELKTAIMQLVYCADMVEGKALGGQDLKIDKSKGNQVYYNSSVVNNATIETEIASDIVSGKYTFFNNEIKKAQKNCWDINHHFPFIKTQVTVNSKTLISLPFYAEDLDKNEQALLKRWCDHVVKEI